MDSDTILFELNGILENRKDDLEFDESVRPSVIALEKTIGLLENNPEQAELIWETFMNLLDCAARDDANHFFGFKIERF